MINVWRARIDQPSTLQPLHHLDGRVCIVVDTHPRRPVVTIYFTDGPVRSMECPRLCLSLI